MAQKTRDHSIICRHKSQLIIVCNSRFQAWLENPRPQHHLSTRGSNTRDHSTICLRVAQTPETTAPCQRKSQIINSIEIKFQSVAQKPETTAPFVYAWLKHPRPQHHLSTRGSNTRDHSTMSTQVTNQ